jgi:hypothetical protein
LLSNYGKQEQRITATTSPPPTLLPLNREWDCLAAKLRLATFPALKEWGGTAAARSQPKLPTEDGFTESLETHIEM